MRIPRSDTGQTSHRQTFSEAMPLPSNRARYPAYTAGAKEVAAVRHSLLDVGYPFRGRSGIVSAVMHDEEVDGPSVLPNFPD